MHECVFLPILARTEVTQQAVTIAVNPATIAAGVAPSTAPTAAPEVPDANNNPEGKTVQMAVAPIIHQQATAEDSDLVELKPVQTPQSMSLASASNYLPSFAQYTSKLLPGLILAR